MPPAPSTRVGSDPLKDYWWLLVAAVVLVGGWLALSSPSGTGSDSVAVAAKLDPGAEQSLHSLDALDNPQGAPGNGLTMPGAQARGGAAGAAGAPGAAVQSGSLYTPPDSAAGGPIPAGASETIAKAARAAGQGGGTSLADALRGVAASGKAPDNGWGGQQARSGFSRPRLEAGQVGASRGGGGDASGAELVLVQKAFGTGGNPGLNLSPLAAGAADAQGRLAAAMEKGPGLTGLRQAQKASLDALKSGDETAVAGGRQSFDGGTRGRTAFQQLKADVATGGSGVSGDDGVPMNLKASDPSKLDQKDFQPPPVGQTKQQQDPNNQQQMQQQMMMMIMGIALTGILGPVAGSVGMGLVSMMGMAMPPAGGSGVTGSSIGGGLNK